MRHKFTSRAWALALIICALVGAGISYHFTLEERFSSIEQKLDKTTQAFQQFQASQEEIYAAKNEELDKLSRQISALHLSQGPPSNNNQQQVSTLNDIRRQITLLQQSQQDGEKNLSNYAAQLNSVRQQIRNLASQPPAALPPAQATLPVDSAPAPQRTQAPANARNNLSADSPVFPRALPVLPDSTAR